MDYNILFLALVGLLILCCVVPMLMMRGRRKGDETRPPTRMQSDRENH